jgi:hypothetical protein
MERRGKKIICWVDQETVLVLTNLLSGSPALDLSGEKSGFTRGNPPELRLSKENS